MSVTLRSVPASLRSVSLRRHRVQKLCGIFLVGIVVLCTWVIHRRGESDAQKQAAFLARFRSSFSSGLVRLSDQSELEEIHRMLMPEYSLGTFRAPVVNEYVVTASFERDGTTHWGRWLYTCNDSHGDGIYKFGFAEAATRAGLPTFPAPGQQYIGWTTELVDGIPSTAGPTATVVSSPASISAKSPFTLVVHSEPGTVCRLQTFPPDASLTAITDRKPDKKGESRWTLALNPKYAGGSVRVIVKCIQPRGTRQLETTTECPRVTILP